MWDPYAEFEKLSLPNGLDIYASQVDREFEIFGFVIHAGAREDIFAKDGVAHFTEHCVSNKVEGWPNEKIRNFFEAQGGIVSLGSTEYAKTTYQCKCQADSGNVAGALDIFGRMLVGMQTTGNIELEREIISQEYYIRYPFEISAEWDLQKNACLFPEHRLASYLRPLGSIRGIRSISSPDILEFYERFYVPANISVVAIGKLAPDTVANYLLRSPFGLAKKGQRNLAPAAIQPDYSALTRYDTKTSLLIGSAETLDRGHYESSAVLPGNIDLEQVMFVKNLLERRLLAEIREQRGWTYEVEAGYQRFQDLYEFSLELPLKIEALGQIEKVVDECIASALADEEIFHSLKEVAINDTLLYDKSYEKICRESMSDIGDFGRIVSLAEVRHARAAITLDDISTILRYLTPDKRLTIISYP